MLQLFLKLAISRALLGRQLQVITSLPSSILSSGTELHNLPFESVGLAGVRSVDPLEFIQSHISATQQERKRNARRGPPAVEPRPFNQPSFGFTDCESFTLLSSTTSSSTIFFSKSRGYPLSS